MSVHRLARADDRNIHYAWDPAIPAALVISPGDEVVVEARSGEDDQVRQDSSAEDLDRLDMRRLHALSGPIAIDGAEPGDVLAIDVLDLEPAAWGFTMMRPGAGFLTGFDTWLRTYTIDSARKVIEIAQGIEVPLAPFLGQMGVAPPDGPRRTIPPGPFGGNIDCRELVAGTRLRLPVFVRGALFSCGDGHAAQGDGEVCLTAVECAMTVRLRFRLERMDWLHGPLVETATDWLTLGAAATVEAAAAEALEAMLDLICRSTGMDRPSAYALASATVDIRINQLVNKPCLGVRAAIEKKVLPPDTLDRLRA